MAHEQDQKSHGQSQVKGLSTGPGAADNTSGGGNATGTPDPDTALRSDAVNKGDPSKDRKKLFPDSGKRG